MGLVPKHHKECPDVTILYDEWVKWIKAPTKYRRFCPKCGYETDHALKVVDKEDFVEITHIIPRYDIGTKTKA